MSEEKQEVKVFKVYYKCDSCLIGTMYPTGMVLSSYPPTYVHKCSNSVCSEQAVFDKTYPCIEYEPINS